jgi:hypothetical protein
MIAFTIPGLTPSPNRMLRMHWSARRRYLHALAWEIRAAMIGPLPEKPLARARVTVWRHSIQPLDVDALAASVKPILDLLQPQGRRHPYGMGFLLDDRADCCALTVHWVRARTRPEQRMVVEIAPLADDVRSAA